MSTETLKTEKSELEGYILILKQQFLRVEEFCRKEKEEIDSENSKIRAQAKHCNTISPLGNMIKFNYEDAVTNRRVIISNRITLSERRVECLKIQINSLQINKQKYEQEGRVVKL